MDLSELIKCYTDKNKMMFTVFCIHIPLSYTILYLYFPQFISLDIYTKSVLSVSSSISLTTLAYIYSFLFNLVLNTIRKEKNVEPGWFEITIPNVVAFTYAVLMYKYRWSETLLFLINCLLKSWVYISAFIIFFSFISRIRRIHKKRSSDENRNKI